MKKQILLINPAQNQTHVNKQVGIYPSGALTLIGTMCQNEGHTVKIIDATVDTITVSEMKKIINYFNPDIVGITMNTFQTKNARLWLETIKEVDENILTVVGGPHPSALELNIFKDFNNIDISVIGEGEFTFLEIVNGKNKEEIKGICYNNKINKLRPAALNLDHVPPTNFDLVDLSKYPGIVGTGKSMFIMASRGCPSNCTYCNKSVFGTKVRYRSPKRVVEDIKQMHEKYGINEIYFQDDTLNLNRRWLESIFNLIINNRLNIDVSYRIAFRANKNLVDEQLLALAKLANVTSIFYGVESGNQEMLNRMKKGLTIEELKRAFKLTHAAGIETTAAFIIGLPGETINTIKDTANMWKEINAKQCGFTLATPFPNTAFQKEIISKNHLLDTNYDNYRLGGNYIRTDELTSEQLEFFSVMLILGHSHKQIHKLPYFTIGKSRMLCNIIVTMIRTLRCIKIIMNRKTW